MRFEQLTNVKIYHALDHPKRREILALILEKPKSPATDIKKTLGLSDGNFNYHITVLIDAQLVINEWKRPLNKGATYSNYEPTDIAKQLAEES
jgi:DNA-binding transcriptional ArsR family regulator